jgi:hypothetical protein
MRLPVFLLALAFGKCLPAQTSPALGLHLGIPIIHETLREGRQYKPYQLLLYYNFANLLKGKKNDLYIYLEPQLVWVHFSPKAGHDWEFGSNLGLEYRWNVSGRTAITAAIGSGPHYVTVRTAQQHRGFIFSDNFTAGLHQRLGNGGLHLDLKLRFRHISNANLAKPNNGIDSWFVLAGLTKDLKR